MIELFEELYGDKLYLLQLADWLEERGDKLYISIRWMAEGLITPSWDERLPIGCPSSLDLFISTKLWGKQIDKFTTGWAVSKEHCAVALARYSDDESLRNEVVYMQKLCDRFFDTVRICLDSVVPKEGVESDDNLLACLRTIANNVLQATPKRKVIRKNKEKS